jgi:D-amino-acid dehydrogenase
VFLNDATVQNIRSVNNGIATTWLPEGGNVEQLHTDAVVICAGTASRHFAAMLGDRVNIYPVKGYSITVPLNDARSRDGAAWVSLLDEKAKIVTSRLGLDRLRVAGTAEFNGNNRDIRADRIRPLVEWTRTMFPDVDTAGAIPWAGLRPMMPNMLPRLNPGRRPGVYYNTGHGHLGWTLSPITAQIVADQIAGTVPAKAKTRGRNLAEPVAA